jgi:crossover junction endodeoxyribonuclease RuvC
MIRTTEERDEMRVLGVDPGLGVTGYGVVEGGAAAERRPPRLLEAGAIRGHRTADLPARLLSIHEELRAVIEEFHPDAVALEDLFSSYRFPRSALLMAHARGTICLAAAQAGVPVWSFAPAEVKNAVVGYGKASKEQVQEMVQHIFGLESRPRPHDVADALALALTGLHRAGSPALSPPRILAADEPLTV